MFRKTILSLALLLAGFALAGAQQRPQQETRQVYFADGYHGGVYGHYDLWFTQFMTDQLDKNQWWKLNLEIEPETWDSVRLKTPDEYAEFSKYLRNTSRTEVTNPSYSQPYLYNVSGESMIRNFEYGIRKMHEHFPDMKFTTYAVEEPCFTSSLPQVLKLFGFKYAVLKNPNTCWGGYARAYGKELVNWVGPDGTSMLTVPRYKTEALLVGKGRQHETNAHANDRRYISDAFAAGIENPVGMTYQDANWKNGPIIGHRPNTEYILWTDYIENKSVGETDDNWRFSQEDVQVALNWGGYVLQRIGQQVRKSENRIVVAEKINSMAAIDNGAAFMQADLDEGWRTLMLAQHHDSWIVPYNGLMSKEFEAVYPGKTRWYHWIERWTDNANEISDKIIDAALASYDSESGGDNAPAVIRVYNPTGLKRTEQSRVELPADLAGRQLAVFNASGKEVSSAIAGEGADKTLIFTSTTPSFGYSSYTVKESAKVVEKHKPGATKSAYLCTMENDMYKMVFNLVRGGVMTSLIAKKEGKREYVDPRNQFGLGEIRGNFYNDGGFFTSADGSLVEMEVIEDTPLTTIVAFKGKVNGFPFTQTISIAAGQRNIDFNLHIDWKGENPGIGEYRETDWIQNRRAYYDTRYMLNVMFPSTLGTGKIYKNAPFDVCESKLQDTFFNEWSDIKHNIILNWVDQTDERGKYGLALLSDHTTSYSHGPYFPLALTVQYSGAGIFWSDYKILGPTNIRYALVPHKGKWDKGGVAEQSVMWNEPLEVSLSKGAPAAERSFVSLSKPGYEITAVKTEGDEVIVRLFNASGDASRRTVTFGFPVKQAEVVDLNGDHMSDLAVKAGAKGASVSTSMPRFGIQTLKLKTK